MLTAVATVVGPLPQVSTKLGSMSPASVSQLQITSVWETVCGSQSFPSVTTPEKPTPGPVAIRSLVKTPLAMVPGMPDTE